MEFQYDTYILMCGTDLPGTVLDAPEDERIFGLELINFRVQKDCLPHRNQVEQVFMIALGGKHRVRDILGVKKFNHETLEFDVMD